MRETRPRVGGAVNGTNLEQAQGTPFYRERDCMSLTNNLGFGHGILEKHFDLSSAVAQGAGRTSGQLEYPGGWKLCSKSSA